MIISREELDDAILDKAIDAAYDAVQPVCWDIVSSQWILDQEGDDYDALYERVNDDPDFNRRMDEALEDAMPPAIDRELEKLGYVLCDGGYRVTGNPAHN